MVYVSLGVFFDSKNVDLYSLGVILNSFTCKSIFNLLPPARSFELKVHRGTLLFYPFWGLVLSLFHKYYNYYLQKVSD